MYCKLPTDYAKRLLSLLLFLLITSSLQAQVPSVQTDPMVDFPVYPVIHNINLADLPVEPGWVPGMSIRDVPRRESPNHIDAQPPEPKRDALLERQERFGESRSTSSFSTPLLNFDGQSFSSASVPDPVGAIGKDYYIQAINGMDTGRTRYVIYNKSDGSVAAGPFSFNAFTVCSGTGDPIVLYDSLAERWFLSEFGNGNSFCVLISQTSDPINGGWFEYNFATPGFPDYPKFGVWHDAYYVSTNESQVGLYALEREEMLLGNPANMVRFEVPNVGAFSFDALTPASASGTSVPPTNSPGLFMRHRDDEAHNPGTNDPNDDFLELYEFHVDWINTGQSTLTGPIQIAVTDFDSHLCGYLLSNYCIEQPGSAIRLDSLREVIMFPLIYKNFDDHASLVGSFVTDVDGNDHAGIRWFELRSDGGPWSLFQEGTFAPDADSRWMSSAAMDDYGNISIAYNVSSSTTFPGLRYAGRLTSDPLGVLTTGEQLIVEGSAANPSGRYGDYSAMSVDPIDGCTFWFTGEYNPSNQWRTRIAAMNFLACTCSPLDSPGSVSAATNGDLRIDLSWSVVAGAESYSVYRSTGPCPGSDWTLLSSGETGTSFSDLTVLGGVTYSYAVTSYDQEQDCESPIENCSEATAQGPCDQDPDFSGLASVQDGQSPGCTLNLSWNEGTAVCPGPLTYNVYRSDTSGFTPDGATLLVSCLSETNYSDTAIGPGQTYYYVVRAEDKAASGDGPCGGNEDTNTVELSGSASGSLSVLFNDDMESGDSNWSADSAVGSHSWQWMDDTSNAHSGQHVFFVADSLPTQDQRLTLSDPIALPGSTPVLLSFWHQFDTQSGSDGGVLEYSNDSGTSWFDILEGDGSSIPANPGRFIQGGYNEPAMSAGPINGRAAWSGLLGNYSEVLVNLDDFAGESLLLRWRFGSDETVPGLGWWLDDVSLSSATSCTPLGCDAFSIEAISASSVICNGESANLNVQVLGGTPSLSYSWTLDPSLSATDIPNPIATPTQTTTYSVHVEDGLSCQDNASITIFVMNLSGSNQQHWEEWRSGEPSGFNVNHDQRIDIRDFCALITTCSNGIP